MDDALEEAQQPGTLLMAAGGMMMLLYGLYALTGLLGLGLGCVGGGFAAMSAVSGDGSFMLLGWQGWVMILGVLGLVIYAGCAAAGFMVFQAGSAMKELRDLDSVKKGMMIAVGGPILGLIVNLGISILSLSFCGVITYTVPQVLMLVLGGAAAFLTNQALQKESFVASFDS